MPILAEVQGKTKEKELQGAVMMVSLGSTVKRRHGFVDDGCQDLIGGGFGGGLKLWIWVFFFFFEFIFSVSEQ